MARWGESGAAAGGRDVGAASAGECGATGVDQASSGGTVGPLGLRCGPRTAAPVAVKAAAMAAASAAELKRSPVGVNM